LSLLGIKPRFLSRTSRSVVAIPTALPGLHVYPRVDVTEWIASFAISLFLNESYFYGVRKTDSPLSTCFKRGFTSILALILL
jgi:hypothetical protein